MHCGEKEGSTRKEERTQDPSSKHRIVKPAINDSSKKRGEEEGKGEKYVLLPSNAREVKKNEN